MRAGSPFDQWPVQAFDERFGFGWFARPAAFVSHSVVPRGTIAAAEILQGWIDLVLRERADEISDAGGLFVFHDWRSSTGYDSDARRVYLERMRSRPRNYLRHSITCVRANPLFRMAIEAGNLVAALTARAKVELAGDPTLALALHRIRPPLSGEPFPGLAPR